VACIGDRRRLWLLPRKDACSRNAMTQAIPAAIIAILGAAICAGPCRSENMRIVPTSPLVKVLRTSTPDVSAASDLRIEGARGETVSAQVVLIPGDSPDTVSPSISTLRSADGRSTVLPRSIRLQWERYVDITANSTGVPLDELVAKAPVSIPDAFWEGAERAIEPKLLQPLWIEVEIPADARPCDYHGELTISGENGRCSLSVQLRVRDFIMPADRHQRVIEWWDVPGRTFEGLRPDSDAYWKHFEQMCELVKRHRQTDVRISWTSILRKTAPDGATYWDTSFFEKFAETAFKCGMRAVHFTSVGRHTKFQLKPDSRTEAVADNMDRLAAVQQVIAKRGWKGRILTSLADEPFIYHEKSYKQLLERVREIAPDIGIIEAIETEDIGDLDIYVPKLSHINLWWPHFEQLKREGKPVWFYTCCFPSGRYPNRFLDQPLLAARELHWISYLYDLDGYLHWGFNWFSPDCDPYSEKGVTPWNLPPGDSQVAYPGREGWLGSLRLSTMRDGLQDYEYLWTLESRLRDLKKRIGDDASWLDPRRRPTELCRRVVQSFYDRTRDPAVLLDTRLAIADEIEALNTSPLLYVQTSPPEGTATPVGPITINVHGVTTPGAKLTINGQPVIPDNITASGCFVAAVNIDAAKPEIVVTAESNGAARTVKRTFEVVE